MNSSDSEILVVERAVSFDGTAPKMWCDRLFLGDCLEVLKQMPSEMVDLIVTSPPYADSRKRTYGGISPNDYVKWFLPISEELKRVLKPDGSFILNIKEKVVDGQRHPYVLNLIIEMQEQGWLWTEEYIWHKKNSYPGKWSNRFRDAWERCLQFNKCKKFKMNQESVMVPMGNWADSRLKNLSETDKKRDNSRVESGFGKNISSWVGRTMAYPTNVLHLATECGNKKHSAAFPKSLPSWFIKLFTDPGDVVLDPFLGSGTTAVATKELCRAYVGIEIQEEYCKLAASNIEQAKPSLDAIRLENKNSTVSTQNMEINQRYQLYYEYIKREVLTAFYDKRFEKLEELKLKSVLKRKNPYLFKAKNIGCAGDFVKSIVDAFLSSQEETIFGNLLEGFAIYVAQTLYGGFKSEFASVDLEFIRNGVYYIVGIKSGTSWGNSDQISKMKDNFKKAKKKLREQGVTSEIVAVNGCMYGKDNKPLKNKRTLKDKTVVDEEPDKVYFKYAGQAFWNFLSDDDNLYQQIIVPIDEEAKKKDELFKSTYDAKVNEMTADFMRYFIKSNQIDWVKLLDYVSKREETELEPEANQTSLFDVPDLEEPLDLADALDLEEF